MNDCIVGVGVPNSSGYLRHRKVWEKNFGPIPDGLHVLHSCDNPPCENPEHLFLGTHSHNMQNMIVKKRHRGVTSPESYVRGDDHWSRVSPEKLCRGSDHPDAKLTEGIVAQMRRLHTRGMTYARLGRIWGVRKAAARRAITGVTWKHV